MTTNQTPAADNTPRFLTMKEAAERLAVSPSTISRACKVGTMPHIRIGASVRIPRAEIERIERGEPTRPPMHLPSYATTDLDAAATPSIFEER